MDFQTRAKLADADVWAAIKGQLGTLTTPDDIEAVVSGTLAAVFRLVHRVQVDPDPAVTAEVIRQMLTKMAEPVTCETCCGLGAVMHEGGDSTQSVVEYEDCPDCGGKGLKQPEELPPR